MPEGMTMRDVANALCDLSEHCDKTFESKNKAAATAARVQESDFEASMRSLRPGQPPLGEKFWNRLDRSHSVTAAKWREWSLAVHFAADVMHTAAQEGGA